MTYKSLKNEIDMIHKSSTQTMIGIIDSPCRLIKSAYTKFFQVI